jgi:hypothetical protein
MLAGYAAWFQTHSGDFAITNRNGFFLYGRVVDFADCDTFSVPERLRVFCPRPESRRGLFASRLPSGIRRDPTYNDEAMEFAKRAIAAHPGAYASAVANDFLRYFAPASPEARAPGDQKWRFRTDVRIPRRVTQGGEGAPPASRIPLRLRVNEAAALAMRDYQARVWTHGPLLAAFLLAGIIGGITGLATGRARPAATAALLFAVSAAGMLLFATTFTIYHFRYVMPAIPLSGPAAVLGAASLVAVAQGIYVNRQQAVRAQRAGGP